MKKILFIIGMLSLIATNTLKAAHEVGTARLVSPNLTIGKVLFIQDNKYPTIAGLSSLSSWGFYDKSFTNKLTLGIDRYSTVAIADFVATVTVQLTSYQPTALGSTPIVTTKVLSVAYEGKNDHQNAATHLSKDLEVFTFNSGYAVLSKITGMSITVAGVATSVMPANVYLEIETDAERFYNLPQNSSPFASSTDVQIKYLPLSDEYEISWARINGAEEYDLEWLWLDAQKNNFWTNNPKIDFRNNSTRIRTSQQSYRVSNIFEKGQVLFRIRGVGKSSLTPNAFDKTGYTPWSWQDLTTILPTGLPSSSTFTSVTAPSNGTDYLFYVTIDGVTIVNGSFSPPTIHEYNKNWQYKATYAEEGKKKEVISYFDGTLRNRQSVTKNNSDNTAIVGETYYDYNGRAVVQALPVPLSDATIKFYQYNVAGKLGFNFDNATHLPYSKKFFDLDSPTASPTTCAVTSGGLDNNYGSANYYSSSNTMINNQLAQGYVPNAEHLPISQTEFTNDNTGRIAKQGGVGPTHQLGSGHETKYFYGQPGQIEMDRLFGSEVGYNSHYKKNMVIDANGQVSISYLDQQGRVIATALTGQGPNNVANLKDASGNPLYALPTATNVIDEDLLNKAHPNDFDTNLDNNKSIGDVLSFNSQVLVPTAGTYTISYDLQGTSYTYSCLPTNACYDCVYDLEINIVDNCQQNPPGFTKITKTLGTIAGVNTNTVCGDQIVNFNTSQLNSGGNQLLVDLAVGYYTITKTLKINQAALTYYLEEYLKSDCVLDTADFINPAGPDTSGCGLTCDECIAALGPVTTYTNNGGTYEEWLDEYNTCKAPCEYTSICETEYLTMLSDVSPGGQYGDWQDGNGDPNPSLHDLSVYNVNNQLTKRKQVNGAGLNIETTDWQHPKYRASNLPGATFTPKYFEDDGTTISKVFVTKYIDATTSAISYSPDVSNTSMLVPVLGSSNQYSIEPQYLANVADFIANWRHSWAKSLVLYHPEYPYYDWCLRNSTQQIANPYSVSIGTGTAVTTNTIYTSDDYDSLLLVTDDVVGLSSSDLAKLCSPFTNDPYWTTNATYYNHWPLIVSPTLAQSTVNQLNNSPTGFPWSFKFRSATSRFNDYQNTSASGGTPISLPVFAAMITTSCAIQYGQPIANALTCLNTSYGITSSMSAKQIIDQLHIVAPTLENKYWDNYRMLYLAMKQEMQQEAAESYVMNSDQFRGCNDCIGDPSFDPHAMTVPFTPYVIFSGGLFPSFFSNYVHQWFLPFPTLNEAHYCNLFTGGLYTSKIKRFPNAKSATDLQNTMSAGDPGASIYANTGLCPNAFYLQNLINSLGTNNQLSSSTLNLSTIPEFNPDLYKVVAGGVIPTTYVPANWTSSLSNANLTLSSVMSIGTNNCPFNLSFPSGSSYDWNNTGSGSGSTYAFLKLYHMVPGTATSGMYNFTILADITQTSGATTSVVTVTLTGQTCIPLTGCSFTPPCAPTTQAKALQVLLNAIAATGNFCSATIASPISLSTNPAIQPTFENGFGALLGPGNWVWYQNPVAPSFIIADALGVNPNTLQISLASLPTCGAGTPFALSNITGNSSSANSFNIAINVPSPTSVPTAILTSTTTGTVLFNGQSLKMGICGFDEAKCTTLEHQVREEMESFLTKPSTIGILKSTALQTLTNYFSFGLNMRQELVGNYQSIIATSSLAATNNIYWQNTTPAASTSTIITGSFYTTTLSPSPTSVPSSACGFSLAFANPTLALSAGHSLTGSYTLSNFTLAALPMVNSNVYDFSVTATFGTSSYTLLGTSSCFGMRPCSECASPNASGGTAGGPCLGLTINNFPCVSTPTFSVLETATTLPFTQLPNCTLSPPLPFNNMIIGNTATFNNGFVANTQTPSQKALFIQGTIGNEFQFQQTFVRPPCACPTDLAFSLLDYLGAPLSTSQFTVYLKDQAGVTTPVTGLTAFSLPGGWTQFSSPLINIVSGQVYTFILKVNLQPDASGNIPPFGITGIFLDQRDFCNTSIGSLPCVQVEEYTPFPEVEYEDPCVQYALDLVENEANELYNTYIDSIKTAFVQGYIKKCMGNAIEQMYMKYNAGDYHFTLYYYDQAGNLVRTVPPEGVHVETNVTDLAQIKTDRNNPNTAKVYHTTHSLQTTYTYNALNQLVKQETPDAGISYFWYDKLGRLVASQNAKQRAKVNHSNNYYSYTRYDYLGRIAEVGEMIIPYDFVSMTNAAIDPLINPTTLPVYPDNLAVAKSEVTRTYYGDDANFTPLLAGTNFTSGSQEYLRSRVASVTIEDIDDANDATYQHATHYSYDVHGNVKELVQENPTLNYAYHKYKKVNYTYDLISGKVNTVAYQPGQIDMFLHRYEYDADNRITNVYTSKDNVIWDQDAKYFYYLHGPMARTEIGNHKVQATDYAYTLQGWIKGVNSNVLDATHDIGKDGYGLPSAPTSGATIYQDINKFNARDAYAYSLTYFNNATNKDYLAINGTTGSANDFVANTSAIAQSPDLFNGNIRQMVTSYLDANAPAKTYNPTSLLKNYTYDQLNRIETATAFDGLNLSSNAWTGVSVANMYNESFTYDQNGNILKAKRNGHLNTSLAMDDLTYNYIAGTNKLDNVTDAIGGTPYGNDFASGQTAGNYDYDAIGNLIADASEGITKIEWTVYGKIKRITRPTGSPKPNIIFNYDASGNRISKTTYSGPAPTNRSGTTYYVRDAQGNVMATYEEAPNNLDIPQLKLGEQHIYGSSRLGLVNNSDNLTAYVGGPMATLVTKTLGYKSYELSNHLQNVLTVVSDRKIAVVNSSAPTVVAYFSSEIITANDYFVYHFEMQGRKVNSGNNYRYGGSNGQEKDKEIFDGAYTAEYWEYDSRTGRRWNLDPVDQISTSNYACFANNPIFVMDINGDVGEPVANKDKDGNITSYSLNTTIYLDNTGNVSPKQFAEVKAAFENVNNVFKGTYKGKTVTAKVTVKVVGEDGVEKPINFQPGQNYFEVTSTGESHVNPDRTTGVINVLRMSETTVPHEWGHLFGLADRYAESYSFNSYHVLDLRVENRTVVPLILDLSYDKEYNPYTNLYSSNTGGTAITQYQYSVMFGESKESSYTQVVLFKDDAKKILYDAVKVSANGNKVEGFFNVPDNNTKGKSTFPVNWVQPDGRTSKGAPLDCGEKPHERRNRAEMKKYFTTK